MDNKIINDVRDYYSEKISKYGAISEGVDWNGKESHFLRFEQLSKVISFESKFSVLDYGCGFGSLVEFLNSKQYDFKYLGFDIAEEMVKKGNELYSNHKVSFVKDPKELIQCDYVLANGIFNVKLKTDEEDWKAYVFDTILKMSELAKKGLSFNILTSYSDEEYKKDYLHYSDPLEIFDFCKKNISKNIALLHDYELYEFTIIIRK